MQIVITRHGHVEGIQPPRFRGRAELTLSEKGQRQIAALAARIRKEFRPAAVYSSPLQRCVQTAQAIGDACDCEVEVTGDLLDLDYGDWQGKTHAEMGELFPGMLERWYAQPHLVRFPLGESLQDLAVRAADLLRRLLEKHAHDTIALVGHDSIDRVLMLQLLEMPLSSYWRLEHEPCSISLVEIEPGRTRLLKANDTSHLAGIV